MSNQIQNKLLNYEAPPPEQAWNKIMTALESDSEFLLSKKLHDYQQAPSPEVWNQIKARLDQENTMAPAIASHKRRSATLIYSAVAAALIVATLLISLLRAPKAGSEAPGVAANVNETPATGGSAREASSPFPDKTAPAATPAPDGDQFPSASSTSPSGRYMMVASTSGEAVKVSKKLKDLFTCSEMDIYCRRQIESLQQKAAASDVMATADVNSVVDLLKSLENHQ